MKLDARLMFPRLSAKDHTELFTTVGGVLVETDYVKDTFRTLVSGSLIMAITLWISSRMVDLQTDLARSTGLLGDANKVASLDQGGSPITYLLAKGIPGQVTFGFVVIAVLYVAAFAYTYVKYRRGSLYRDEGSEEAQLGTAA